MTVDTKMTETERRYLTERDNKFMLMVCANTYKQLDIPMADWNPQILLDHTKYVMANQAPLDFRTLIKRHTKGARLNKAIVFNGDYGMSCQGNYGAYCSPRVDLESVYQYSSLEVGMVGSFPKNIPSANKEGSIFYGMPHSEDFTESGWIAPWMPIEKIQEVFDFMRARFGLEKVK